MVKKLVKAALYGGESEQILLKKTSFGGMRGDKGEWYSNVELGSLPYLRAHKPLIKAEAAGIPSDLRAIRSYGDRLLLLNMESGFFGIYYLKDGQVAKAGTTVKSFPESSDGSDYCSRLLVIDEQSEQIDEGCAHRKLLFFPTKQTACLNAGGDPSVFSVLPSKVPALEHAAIRAGRLYGSVGQSVYVSGAEGCFDWSFDEEGEEPLPAHAWKGGSATDTADDPTVTAVIPYKNTVLVFRKRALSAVVGSENPFVMKELYKVGTSFESSVKEVGGRIYFITENKVARFDGNRVDYLPPLPEGAVLNGAAGVLDGRYCFYVKDGVRHYLYSYDEQSDSYGVCKCYKKIRALENCGSTLYALMGEVGDASPLYCISENRSSTYMEAEFPLLKDSFRQVFVRGVSVRMKMTKGSSARITVKLTDREGGITGEVFDIFQSNVEGEVTLIRRKRMKRASGVSLLIEAMGDVKLMGYEVACTVCEKERG